MATKPSIIDLSHHNTVTSWSSIRRAGIVGIIHKSTEGTTYIDKTYSDRCDEAGDVGLKWGAYHFMRPGNIPVQMEFFIEVADLLPRSRICLDYEDEKLSLDELREAVECLRNMTDYEIAIYSGHLLKEQLGDDEDELLGSCSLWLAQYTTGTPSWPTNTWSHWDLWQYTDKGSWEGISGNVDLNAFNGSRNACRKWMGPAEEEETPAEVRGEARRGETQQPAMVTLTVAPGTVVLINGVAVIAE